MLVDEFDAFLIDLDGVIYLGSEPLPGAATSVRELRARSKACRFLSNDPRPHRSEVVSRLAAYGIPTTVDEVITSGWTAAQFAKKRGHQEVMVIGSQGLRHEVIDADLAVVDGRSADAVIVGCDETVCYKDLDAGSACIAGGAEFIATNRDATYPIATDIRAMATGGIVAAIEAASGHRPITVGKPMPPMFRAAAQTLTPDARIAVVGDGPRTDVEGARRAQLFAILVPEPADTSNWPSIITPDVVIGGLADLFSEHPRPRSKPRVPPNWPFVVQTCVAGVVFDRAGQVLLERRRDTDVWALPTGRVEPGESLQQAIEREVFEETGLKATASRLCGVYSDPLRQVFADESGWVTQAITIVFACSAVGEPLPDGVEVSDARFYSPDRLPSPTPLGDEEWISAALHAQSTGEVAFEHRTSVPQL